MSLKQRCGISLDSEFPKLSDKKIIEFYQPYKNMFKFFTARTVFEVFELEGSCS